jgi:hypothetical protein
MASFDAFLPQSLTILVVTSGTTLTPLSQPITFPTLMGIQIPPPVAWVSNLSAGVVWFSITIGARTAAIPAGGATSFEVPIQPNQTLTFRYPWAQGGAGSEGTGGGPGVQGVAALNINTIAVGTSAQLAVTFGEGKF